MVRPCKRRKVRNPSGKVTRRGPKNVVKRTVVHDPTVSRFWDDQKTIHQNFAAVGLTSKVNADLASGKIKQRLAEWQSERFERLVEKGEENMKREEGLGGDVALHRPMLDEQDIFAKLEDMFYQNDDAEDDSEEAQSGAELDLDPDAVKRTVIEELEWRSRQVAPKKAERLSPFEREYIGKLVAKYGDNYKKMSLDHRTNSRQLTARELEKMASKLK